MAKKALPFTRFFFILGLTLGAITSFSTALAEDSGDMGRWVSSFDDWSVFVTDNPKSCWIATTPLNSRRVKNGVLERPDIDDVQLVVSIQPDAPGKIETSYSFDRDFPKHALIRLNAPLANVDFFAQDNWSWPDNPKDDVRLKNAFSHAEQLGALVTLETNAAELKAEDEFSMQGYWAALKKAGSQCR